MAALLALAGALGWGVGDFLGGVAARRLAVLTVLVVSQASGSSASALGARLRGRVPRASASSLPARSGRRGAGRTRPPSTGASQSGRWGSSRRSRRPRRSCRSPSTRRRGSSPAAAPVARHRARRDRHRGAVLGAVGHAAAAHRRGRRAGDRRGPRLRALLRRHRRRRRRERRVGRRRGSHRLRPDRRRWPRSPRARRSTAPRRLLPMLVAVGVFDTGANILVAAATTRGARRDRRGPRAPLSGRHRACWRGSCSASACRERSGRAERSRSRVLRSSPPARR